MWLSLFFVAFEFVNLYHIKYNPFYVVIVFSKGDSHVDNKEKIL